MLWKSQIFKLHSRKKIFSAVVPWRIVWLFHSLGISIVHSGARVLSDIGFKSYLNYPWYFFYHFPTPPHQAPRVLGNAHWKSRSYPVSRNYECVSLLKLHQSGSNSSKLSVCVPVSTASRNPCSYLSFSTTITRLGDTNHTLPLTHTHNHTVPHVVRNSISTWARGSCDIVVVLFPISNPPWKSSPYVPVWVGIWSVCVCVCAV